MTFSEILMKRRKALGLSQEALAEKVQVSRQAVSKWETDEAMPDMAKLIALSDALEMSMDALCGRSESAPLPQPAASPAKPASGRGARVACVILALLLLVCVILLFSAAAPTPAGAMPDTVEVSGVMFRHHGEGRLDYSFVPSVMGEEYRYEISFADMDGKVQTFDVPCSGGICVGSAKLSNYATVFNVSVVVSNGGESRAVAAAFGLNLSGGTGASWQPVE